MTGARSVLGFPTTRDAVHALHAEGLLPEDIATRIGTTEGTVRVLLCRAGLLARRPDKPLPGRASPKLVELNDIILRSLREHAARREMQTQSLAVLILETVIEAGLVDAVLDDRRFAS